MPVGNIIKAGVKAYKKAARGRIVKEARNKRVMRKLDKLRESTGGASKKSRNRHRGGDTLSNAFEKNRKMAYAAAGAGNVLAAQTTRNKANVKYNQVKRNIAKRKYRNAANKVVAGVKQAARTARNLFSKKGDKRPRRTGRRGQTR